ncbi:MAG: membrane protein insertase YidC [Clostridiales bacterium]|nr:membrane protein insertase YidC [Clostridiales bacterium]
MSLASILYQLFLSPITLILEAVYAFSFYCLRNCGAAIIPLSLVVNLLLLPFYNRADAIQTEEREREEAMEPFIEHIKKTFKGDERYMMLQTFYRENHYKPIYALRSTLALILEIPFFIAAYRFLSNLSVLKGASFLMCSDLGKPDELIKVAGISINVLPIFMTLINILSSEIYTHGRKLKEKLQLHGMALIFLVLLYNSPSGLVFYWTLNNIFSLVKNIVNTRKDPKTAKSYAFSLLGGAIFVSSIFIKAAFSFKILIMLIGLLFLFPLFFASSEKKEKPSSAIDPPKFLFFLGALFISILTGLLIPSAVIQSSPSEFIILSSVESPVRYIFFSFLSAAGLFLVWGGLFYYLMSPKSKRTATMVIWAFAITGIFTYLIYGKNADNLSSDLRFDLAQSLPMANKMIDLLLTLVLIGLTVLIFKKQKEQIIRFIAPVLILAISIMSVYNIYRITNSMTDIRREISESQKGKPTLAFSKDEQNVVVFMLDRSISAYLPYIFQEKPEVAEQYDGFVWYPNTLSYGIRTLTAAPALYGGYDYTPLSSNLRSDVSLKDKHNEALLTMPLVFSEAGYDVTVVDPPYAGYSEFPDLSVFDDYPSIEAYNIEHSELFRDSDSDDYASEMENVWNRCFFCYGLMKTCPLVLQSSVYTNGSYFSPDFVTGFQNDNDPSRYSVSYNLMNQYLYSYNALCALPEISTNTNTDPSFFMIQNCAAHNVLPLQTPDYVPQFEVDNTEYDNSHPDRFTYNGNTLPVDSIYRTAFYDSNMAALIQLGNWMDKLRELDVYDNTRIIIVADHGWPMEQIESMIFGDGSSSNTVQNPEDAMGYNPLLLVKDFGSTGEVKTDYSFMTNADTPYLALTGIVDDPLSPFTGRPLFQPEEKEKDKLYVLYSDLFSPEDHAGNIYPDDNWYSVSNQDVLDKNNWQKEDM